MGKASSVSVLWILIGLGLLGVAGALPARLSVEAQRRSVDVVVDYDAYSELFRSQGRPEAEGFASMKSYGATAVAFTENSLERLQSSGKLRWYPGTDFARQRKLETLEQDAEIDPARLYMVVYDPSTFQDLLDYLTLFLGSDKVREWGGDQHPAPASHATPRVLEVTGTEHTIPAMGLGFSQTLVDRFREMGYRIVLRPENKVGARPPAIEKYFARMPKADAIVFGGARNEALGYPDTAALDAVVAALKSGPMALGTVEVPTPKAALKGQEYLLRKLWDARAGATVAAATQEMPPAETSFMPAVRVQSISPAQLSKMEVEDAVDMFGLGVRERNVRMIYLRPFADPGPDDLSLLDTNDRYLKSLVKALEAGHLTPGPASEFPRIAVPLWSALLLNVAAGAAVSLLWWSFRPQTPAWLLLAVPVLAAVGCLGFSTLGRATTWAKLAALVAGLAMPTLATAVVTRGMAAATSTSSRVQGLLRSLGWLLEATAISLLGGCMVAALLAYTPFMLEADQFRGIKLLMIVPPLLVLAYVVQIGGQKLRTVAREVLDTPMTFGYALGLIVLAAAITFYIMRTGNTDAAAATDWERSLRVVLQNIFVARPRFKDFMLGHPALILAGVAAVFGASGDIALHARRGVLFLLVVAAIGQSDVVDTFAHVHTPFLISLLRVFHGLWLGALVGAAFALVWPRPAPIPDP